MPHCHRRHHNSGKSVCVNSILSSLLLTNSPSELRLVLVDPKRVELTGYNHIPHLLAPVVVDPERVIGALQWVIREMDARYHKFNAAGVRNISEFNRRSPDEHLPYLVVVIDELADLMMMAPDETERCITPWPSCPRHRHPLIIATQRPSVDVVTGLIRPTCQRASPSWSPRRGQPRHPRPPGAEKLLGRGDMLYQLPTLPPRCACRAPMSPTARFSASPKAGRPSPITIPTLKAAIRSARHPSKCSPTNGPLKQGALWDDGSVSNEESDAQGRHQRGPARGQSLTPCCSAACAWLHPRRPPDRHSGRTRHHWSAANRLAGARGAGLRRRDTHEDETVRRINPLFVNRYLHAILSAFYPLFLVLTLYLHNITKSPSMRSSARFWCCCSWLSSFIDLYLDTAIRKSRPLLTFGSLLSLLYYGGVTSS